MRKDFGVKPCMYPEPVLMIGTYDDDGTPNLMAAAWGGIHEDAELSICISPEHKTVPNLLARKALTVSFATEDTIAECDYLGMVSGNEVPDKVSKAGLHAVPSAKVDAPLFEELPMSIECRVISYNESNCECILEIVNVSADESVLDSEGRVDPRKLKPVIYDGMNHRYHRFGDVVGKAFSDGKRFF